jgi:hypothetical protein
MLYELLGDALYKLTHEDEEIIAKYINVEDAAPIEPIKTGLINKKNHIELSQGSTAADSVEKGINPGDLINDLEEEYSDYQAESKFSHPTEEKKPSKLEIPLPTRSASKHGGKKTSLESKKRSKKSKKDDKDILSKGKIIIPPEGPQDDFQQGLTQHTQATMKYHPWPSEGIQEVHHEMKSKSRLEPEVIKKVKFEAEKELWDWEKDQRDDFRLQKMALNNYLHADKIENLLEM